MDNLAHTLVGAALARAVAGSRLARAGLVGAIAGNSPDFTEIFVGLPGPRPDYLVLHRGVTHSIALACVQAVLLTVLFGLLARLWLRYRPASASRPPPWAPLGAAVAAAVLSHLFLDWQGSYGLRPFLPWDGTWYYGDWVAIADPFFWIVPLIGLAWGLQRHWIPLAAVLMGGGLMTYIMIDYDRSGTVAPWVWAAYGALTAIAIVGWMRYWFGPVASRRAAVLAMLVLALYSGAQGVVVQLRRADVRQLAAARFGPSAQWAALTNVGEPFTWDAVYASADTVIRNGWRIPRHLDHPIVRAALRETAEGRAMALFARFLIADVDSTPRGTVDRGGLTIYLSDARYARSAREGWMRVSVRME